MKSVRGRITTNKLSLGLSWGLTMGKYTLTCFRPRPMRLVPGEAAQKFYVCVYIAVVLVFESVRD